MINKSLDEFSKVLASKEPTPGGGGASGLVGAIAASLSEMVTSLTTGKKKYAEYEAEIQSIMKEAEELRIELLASINKDKEAFLPLAKAYSMDKDAPNYIETMEQCLKDAASVPMLIGKLCTKVIDLDYRLADIGSKLAISDAATSAMLAYGALYGAEVNVKVNTRLMKDKDYANNLEKEIEELVNVYAKKAHDAYDKVIGRLNG